jgi:hypothetical protein
VPAAADLARFADDRNLMARHRLADQARARRE